MPIVLSNKNTDDIVENDAEVNALLYAADGRLRLEGQVVEGFVEGLDLTAAVDALAEIAEVSEAKLGEDEHIAADQKSHGQGVSERMAGEPSHQRRGGPGRV